jgi:DUF4097 and DUF4098 domain-containing protein YvlB
MRHFVLALTLVLIAGVAVAGDHGHDWDSGSEEDCNAHHFRFNDHESVVQREDVAGAASLRSLKVRTTNGPVSVRGGASAYGIVVCKAAEDDATLRQIQVSLRGNELVADGPANGRWTVAYRISVPRNADLDLESKNGPLSMKDVDGHVVAHAKNGPISLRNVSGNVDAQTTNGPISLSGGAGNVKAIATNGPVSIHLQGTTWQNGSLEASTSNGPLTVKLPKGYATGVLIETDGNGPVSCNFDGCDDVRTSLRGRGREPRRFELGKGPQNVRLSTSNGPLSIKEE